MFVWPILIGLCFQGLKGSRGILGPQGLKVINDIVFSLKIRRHQLKQNITIFSSSIESIRKYSAFF